MTLTKSRTMVKKATKLLLALTFFVVCKVKYDSAGAENEASSIRTSREDGVEKKEEDDVSQSCEEETKRRIAHLNKVCDRWKQVEGNGGHVTDPKPKPKNVQVGACKVFKISFRCQSILYLK